MARSAACAVVCDDPPQVFIAENRPEVDVYPSFELYTKRDVGLDAHELEFTPLFKD